MSSGERHINNLVDLLLNAHGHCTLVNAYGCTLPIADAFCSLWLLHLVSLFFCSPLSSRCQARRTSVHSMLCGEHFVLFRDSYINTHRSHP